MGEEEEEERDGGNDQHSFCDMSSIMINPD